MKYEHWRIFCLQVATNSDDHRQEMQNWHCGVAERPKTSLSLRTNLILILESKKAILRGAAPSLFATTIAKVKT